MIKNGEAINFRNTASVKPKGQIKKFAVKPNAIAVNLCANSCKTIAGAVTIIANLRSSQLNLVFKYV